MIKNLDLNEISENYSSIIRKDKYQSVERKNLGKDDLIPFWYYLDKEKPNSIETIIPLYPYSKDLEKLKYIKNVLGNYRMTL